MYCGFLSYFFVCILHIPVCFYCCLKQQHLYSLYVIVCMRELKLYCALHFVGIRMCEIVSNNLFPFVKFLNLMDLCVCVWDTLKEGENVPVRNHERKRVRKWEKIVVDKICAELNGFVCVCVWDTLKEGENVPVRNHERKRVRKWEKIVVDKICVCGFVHKSWSRTQFVRLFTESVWR